jgi:hypothetical protein
MPVVDIVAAQLAVDGDHLQVIDCGVNSPH